MPIPQSDASQMFDHSPHQDEWDRHGRGQVPDRHGSFPGTIAGVLYVPAPVGARSRCGSTRNLEWGLTGNRPAHRARQRSAGFDSLRIHVLRFIILRFSAAGDAPVPRRNSDKHFHLFGTIFAKGCIRTNRCKLRHSVTTRFHIAHTLLACPAPCCQ
jgi:hypothetical protein